jgi:glycerol dehydrogenase
MGPSRWIGGEGAWEAAVQELKGWPQPIGLLAEAGLLRRFRKPLVQGWLEAGLHIELLSQADGAECSAAGVEAVLAQARPRSVKSLLGLGGGRILDLAKLSAAQAGWRLATAPTSAATSACGTAVAVRNGADGAFEAVVDLAAPAELCLVDLAALREAPARLLAAGLADTLAKWLEWKAVEPAPQGFGAGAGWALAQRAAETCEALGSEALQQPSSAAFEACIEACLLWSSAASCAGQAPAAAAHSLANALTRQPAGKALLHGEAVGLGLLWQESLLAEARRGNMEVQALKALLASWGLPVALPVGLDLDRLCADALAADETVHALALGLSPAGAMAHLPQGH